MGFGEVAAVLDAAVGENGNIFAGALLERITGGGAVGHGGHLGDADTEDGTGRADRAGADTDEKRGCARFHQLSRGLERDAVAEHDRDGRVAAELCQVHGLGMGRVMPGGRHLRRHDEQIRAGFHGGGGDPGRGRRNGGNGGKPAAGFDLLNALCNEIVTHRGGIQLLHLLDDMLRLRFGDLRQNAFRVIVARLQPFAV